jgi:hypothetical protein
MASAFRYFIVTVFHRIGVSIRNTSPFDKLRDQSSVLLLNDLGYPHISLNQGR